MSRLVAPSPDDPRLWRKALARLHPDAGGDSDLFLWATAVRERIAEERQACPNCPGRRPERPANTSDRVPYSEELAYIDDHAELTMRALSIAQRQPEPYRSVLGLLIDHVSGDHGRGNLKQSRGASYKQLALIAHLAGMSKTERSGFYELARAVPLSESHAAHVINRLKERSG